MDEQLDPKSPDRIIAWLAARQHGVVSWQQLLDAGLSRTVIDRRVRIGLLHRVYRGVFAVGHPRLTPEGRWMAAVLAYGDNAALSHASAAALWTVRPSASAWIDISVASHGGRAKRSGIRLHRCATLTAEELTTHGGIPVTTLERTLLDIAGMIARPALERAIERAEILRLLDAARLRAVIDAHRRHRGAAPLRAALELYRDDEMTRSDLEAFFRDLCARHDLPRPRVNSIIHGEEVDFLWPGERLVVETDGRETHLTRAAFERDRAKDARLTLAGYRVVRLTHHQVEHERNATVATVVALLRATTSPPAQGAPGARPAPARPVRRATPSRRAT